MKLAVIGGDKRTVFLCDMLARDGHRVYTYALERGETGKGVQKIGCLQGCVYGADYVILPVPAETGGVICSPLSDEHIEISALTDALWAGQIVCGGRFSDETCRQAIDSGIYIEDIMRRPSFAWGNAALTAESALGMIMRSGESALSRCRVLISGWGRIGKLLALKLRALGAEVTVASRRGDHRAEARAMGISAVGYEALPGIAPQFDFVVNTVPAPVLDESVLRSLSAGVVLIELASPPGGYDRSLCAALHINSIAAPGLPGRCLPHTAAELIRDSIYEIIDEQEEQA